MSNMCMWLCLFVLATMPQLCNAESVQEINQQIESLNVELKNFRTKAFNEEMEAQPLMFDNWDKYSDNIESNEENEKKILEIKKKIKALEARKQALLKELPPV